MNKRIDAFSLIELMIVITIIGILAAVAVPSYQSYVVRSKLANSFTFMSKVINDLIEQHAINGDYPTSITVAGVTIASGNQPDINTANIKALRYVRESAQSAHFGVIIQDIGVPGYVANPANAEGGTNNEFWFNIAFVNNSYIKDCGLWSAAASTYSIPIQYLPASCQCTNIGAISATPGTACS